MQHNVNRLAQFLPHQEPSAEPYAARRAKILVAMRASFEAQEQMANTYLLLDRLSKINATSKTNDCIDGFLDALRMLNHAMAVLETDAMTSYRITAKLPDVGARR